MLVRSDRRLLLYVSLKWEKSPPLPHTKKIGCLVLDFFSDPICHLFIALTRYVNKYQTTFVTITKRLENSDSPGQSIPVIGMRPIHLSSEIFMLTSVGLTFNILKH